MNLTRCFFWGSRASAEARVEPEGLTGVIAIAYNPPTAVSRRQKEEVMAVETIEQLRTRRDELVDERRSLDWDATQRHYLRTEMVEPFIGAKIIGGTVLGDGGADPYMPIWFIEQNGKRYSVVISSDDEMNDGGRVFIEEGYVVMTPDGFSANNFDR